MIRLSRNGRGRGAGRPLKLCLAASGGGHVRQLLDLESVWKKHDYVFVTEDTALGRSLAADHPVRFVSHYAVGQARLGRPLAMIRGALANLFQSIAIVWRERPDVVISTGAGAVFFTAAVAKLTGARLIAIESFARFDAPSKFARAASRIADRLVVQAEPLKRIWPHAELFDPLRAVEGSPPAKQKLIFATVGATLPFERLVDSALAFMRESGWSGRMILQIGEDRRALDGGERVEIVESLPFDRVREILDEAEIVLCHGGTGSLITALRAGCRVIAMPRRFDLAEHYDDHQEEITAAFAARGLIDIAQGPDDIAAIVNRGWSHPPRMATTDHGALVAWLNAILEQWRTGRR